MTNLVVDKGVIYEKLRNCTDLRMEWEEMTLFMKCHELWSWRWICSLVYSFSFPFVADLHSLHKRKQTPKTPPRFRRFAWPLPVFFLRWFELIETPRSGVSHSWGVESARDQRWSQSSFGFGVGILVCMTFSMNLRQQQKQILMLYECYGIDSLMLHAVTSSYILFICQWTLTCKWYMQGSNLGTL